MQKGVKIPRPPLKTEKAQLAGYLSHRRNWGTMIPDVDIQRATKQIVEEAYIAVFGQVVGDNPHLSMKVMIVMFGPPESTQVFIWTEEGDIQEVTLGS